MSFTLIIMSIVILMITLSALMNLAKKKMNSQNQKWMQFECGFNVMTPSHLPFSFQFFLVAILFLIFDIEIALVLSFPLESKTISNSVVLFSFLLILTIGLIYEWQKGKIKWSN